MRKSIIFGTVFALASMLVVGNVASAHSLEASASTHATSSVKTFIGKIFVHKNDKALIAGTVQSVGSSTLSVAAKNTTWTVLVTSDTKFDHKITLANIAVGDNVIINGSASTTASSTITAKHINDTSIVKRINDNKKLVKKISKDLKHKILKYEQSGTVQAVATSSLSVKDHKGQAVTVNTDAKTVVFSSKWLPLSLGDIAVGNAIKAYGTTTATSTLQAALIVNLSR